MRTELVLASSGAPDRVDAYLDLFDGRQFADAWTTNADVDRSKPEPDLLDVASGCGARWAVVIGDSVWGFRAAVRAGRIGYGIRTGGFSPGELLDAGAREVFDSLPDLHHVPPTGVGPHSVIASCASTRKAIKSDDRRHHRCPDGRSVIEVSCSGAGDSSPTDFHLDALDNDAAGYMDPD